jgi:transposase, IS5 family
VGRHGLSKANEESLARNGFVSRIDRKKPPRRPMPESMRRANAIKSKVRSGVEHAFAAQKDKIDLFVRTVGIARATRELLANDTTEIEFAYHSGLLGARRFVPPCG